MCTWREKKERNRIIKTQRVPAAMEVLNRCCVKFDRRNNDQHLIIEGFDCFIDFWPSTGNWATRLGEKGRGLNGLLKLMGK